MFKIGKEKKCKRKIRKCKILTAHSFCARHRRHGVVFPPIVQSHDVPGNRSSAHCTTLPTFSKDTDGTTRNDPKQRAFTRVQTPFLLCSSEGTQRPTSGVAMKETYCKSLPEINGTPSRLTEGTSKLSIKLINAQATYNASCQNTRLLHRPQTKQRRIGICEGTEPEETKRERRRTSVLMKKFDIPTLPKRKMISLM